VAPTPRKKNRYFALKDGEQLLALEKEMNAHLLEMGKTSNKTLTLVKKVSKNVGALRRHHYGRPCGG
jgi:hypothetical protein